MTERDFHLYNITPPLYGVTSRVLTYILLHRDYNKDGLTDLKMIRWSRSFWLASGLRIVELQSGDFRNGVRKFVSLRQLLFSLPELMSRAAVPADQQTQGRESHRKGDPEQNREMRNGRECVSGSLGEIFWGQSIVFEFSHLILNVIHFIISMCCLLHDFGRKEKWIEGPRELKGFRFNPDTVVRVDCVIK